MDQSIVIIIFSSIALVIGIVLGRFIFELKIHYQFEVTYLDNSSVKCTMFVSGLSKGDALNKFECYNGIYRVLSVKRIE